MPATSRQPHNAEVLIVGAGPIGIELAVNLRALGVSYIHVEAKQLGYTMSWYPRQTRFFSSPDRIAIAGVPLQTPDQAKASREQYLAYLVEVVQQFGLEIQTYERVERIESVGDGRQEPRFAVTTTTAAGQRCYRVNHVVVAIGDMHGPRSLTTADGTPVPGADQPHVSQYFDEPHPYIGQELLIVGSRNSAVEAAIRCHRAGAHVKLCCRREQLDSSIKYWLKPEIEWLISRGDIEFHPSVTLVQIDSQHVLLQKVDEALRPIPHEAPYEVTADFVLALIGYCMDPTLLAEAGVELVGESRAPKLNPNTMETNVPGLFVAGTAAAGTQLRFRLFIENCHAHVARIVQHLTGEQPPHINPLAMRELPPDERSAET